MGKKSPPPKPPDLQPITDAQIQIAEQANEIAREQMGMSKEQFDYFKEASAAEMALAKEQADRNFGLQTEALNSSKDAQAFAQKVGQVQMDAMNQQMGYATEDRERYKSVFLPMQDRYIAEANAYDTTDRREAEAARQMVDIQRQSEAQRANADAKLRSMGVDPSQMRSQSMLNQMGVATAANQALAGNMGRQNIEDRGRAMRESAINMGNGLPVQSQNSFAGSTNSGNSAVGAGAAGQGSYLNALNASSALGAQGLSYRQNALQSAAQLTGSATQWAGLGNSSMGMAGNQYGNAANTMNSGYNNQMGAWNAGQQQSNQGFSNIMSLGSMAAGFMMAEGGAVDTKRAGAGKPAKPDKRQRMPDGRIMGVAPAPFQNPEPMSRGEAISRQHTQNERRGEYGSAGVLHASEGINGGVPAAQKKWGNSGTGEEMPREKTRWQKAKDAVRKDRMERGYKGPGEDGKMAIEDRFSNAALAGKEWGERAPAKNYFDNEGPINRDNERGYTYAAEGAAIPRGPRAIPRRQARDQIPAMLSEGEYVIPADVVSAIGLEKLDKLVMKYHREDA